MRTLKQTADELHISVRTLQRYIKRLNIATYRQGKETLIDENAKQLIQQHTRTTATNDTHDRNNDTHDKNNDTHDRNNDTHDTEIQLLKAQIELMQSQINDLKADKEQLYKQIDTLSAALTNAQTLHHIEQQQKAIETAAEIPENEPQKQGIFARLFRKKTR